MLGLSNLKHTKVYQEALEEGVEQGLEKGLETGLKTGLKQGREEGVREGVRQVAIEMLASGMSVEQVHQLTKLPMQEIRQIEQSISKG